MRTAILYICTGDYWRFWEEFRGSAELNLLASEERFFVVFSDQPADRFPGADLVVHQDSLGWPMNTLYRFRMFLRIEDELRQHDRVVFFNANCVFRAPIQAIDLFGEGMDLVACRHPGFFAKAPSEFTYERRLESTAGLSDGKIYVAGGLMGGRSGDFLEVCQELHRNIERDFDRGLLAIWHDESHWNAYINRRVPEKDTKVHFLDPGYLFPEGWNIPFDEKILLREKSRIVDVDRVKGVQAAPKKVRRSRRWIQKLKKMFRGA